jgi:myo-inositol-1(or 4)-monophosphatase
MSSVCIREQPWQKMNLRLASGSSWLSVVYKGAIVDSQQWLTVFQGIGKTMRAGIAEFLSREGGTVPLGRGAGGDKTFPVDRWAEDIVIAGLEEVHRHGEAFTLISEELGIRKFGEGRAVVVVDPIDGSNNAKTGVPLFAVSIALLEGTTLGDLRTGYVMNLPTGDEFRAVKGNGAFKNGKRITTPANDEITIVAYEASTPGTDIPRILPLLGAARRARCFGSLALDLAFVASGAASVFATANRSRAFDFAAGMLILREAGGVITDLDGNNIDHVSVGLERTVPLLAAKNAAAHAKALEILSPR